MTDTRHENTAQRRPRAAGDHGASFLKGLFGGALLGTVVGVFFATEIRAALRNVRRQAADAAVGASDAATDTYQHAATRVGDAIVDLQQKGRGAYGKALSAVVRGAEDIKERATEARTGLDQEAAAAPIVT